MVLIPKYGLEGTVFFEEKDKPKPRLIYDDEVQYFQCFYFGVSGGGTFSLMVPRKDKIIFCVLQNLIAQTDKLILFIISHFRISSHI